jgi:uncharacterized protein
LLEKRECLIFGGMKRSNAAGIPKSVGAARAISGRQSYAGRVPFAQLSRLAPQLASRDGGLDVTLDAGKDGAGAWLTGRIDGELVLTCQRGLHPFTWPCHLEPRLRLVTSEAEEERVLKDTEPYLVQDDQLPLRDLVEDEVLLAMPMMPRCDDPDCVKKLG